MSRSNDTTAQQLSELTETSFIFNCMGIALVALPIYEYIITIDQEVALVWSRKTRFSLQSMLLVSTRISMLLLVIFSVTVPARTCKGVEVWSIFQVILDCAGCIQTALFSALRVSAVHDRSIAIFVVILALNLSPIATNLFRVVRTTYVQDPDESSCFQMTGISDSLVQKLVLVTRAPVIVADVLVLVLTWARTYQQVIRIGAAEAPLSTCLARDGTVYFVILLIMNALEIATLRTNHGAPVDIAVAVLPPILISRFMLNLRRAGDSPYSSSADGGNTKVVSSVRFQLPEHVVGSMGEPLEDNASGLEVTEEIEDVGEGGSGYKEGDVEDAEPSAGAGQSYS